MAEPIAFGADWSAGQISGDVLSRFRYTDDEGQQWPLSIVLRYADFPGQQHAVLTAAEYESHLGEGIRSLLIYQRTTRDPDGGEARGREYGKAAVAYARKIGYREGEPIFATADAPIGNYNLDVAEAFFRGFAVEARAAGYSAGGYGFRDVIYRLQDRDVVDVLWLCGAESGWRPGIALYQWNNGRIYPDGIEADLVKVFEPFDTIREDDFLMGLPQWQQDRLVARVLRMSMGTEGENFDGEQWVEEQAQRDAFNAKLDVIGAAIQQLHDDPGTAVSLTPEQLAALAETTGEATRKAVTEAASGFEQALVALKELLAETDLNDEAQLDAALRTFFGRAAL